MNQKKPVLTLFLILIAQIVLAQDYSDSWTGYFSYLDIKDISQGNAKVFGAAENAIFIYDTQTNQMQELSTINGLSGETISSIEYVEDNGLLFIGFENGLVQIYFESNQEFKTVVDILEKPTIPAINKRINHFKIHNGFAYISTNYGISLYDINNLEFGDSYFIGANGAQIKVSQLVVFDNHFYAATAAGVFYADASNPNLIDYQQWSSFATNANWVGIQEVNNKLFVARNNSYLYEIVSNGLTLLEDYAGLIQDIRKREDKLVVTTIDQVHVYTAATFLEIALVEPNTVYPAKFSSALITDQNEIYIGTKKQLSTGKAGFGILKTTVASPETFEEIHPESPLSNKYFQIRYQSNQLWATHGGFSISYAWGGGTQRTGISHLIDKEWQNITYDSLTTVSNKPWYLSYLAINPFNSSEVNFSSFYSGIINRTPEALSLYNQNNSTIVSFSGDILLPVAVNYDSFGDFWVTVSRNNMALNRFSNGNWTTYNLQNLIEPSGSNLGFAAIEFDANQNIFLGSHNYGIVGFKPDSGEIKSIKSEEQNLPSPSVRTIKIDKQNQVWFGMDKGLRVIYDVDAFFNDPTYEPSEIIILENGAASELLYQQYVSDIEVDGANNKWVATLSTGAFYFSSDAQETIYHFTTDNSPLPSNNVIDIALDEINGVVYMATDKGLVSFNSETSSPDVSLDEAYVYPNPVRPNFNMNDEKIKIKGITGNVNIKITDIEGNLVTEAETRTNLKFKGYNLEISGGTALWNGKNMSNNTVASGVYMVMISDLDSFETKVLKIMVVR